MSAPEPKQYAACIVLATNRLDVNHTVRDLLGVSKASFASAEEMAPERLPIFVDGARALEAG